MHQPEQPHQAVKLFVRVRSANCECVVCVSATAYIPDRIDRICCCKVVFRLREVLLTCGRVYMRFWIRIRHQTQQGGPLGLWQMHYGMEALKPPADRWPVQSHAPVFPCGEQKKCGFRIPFAVSNVTVAFVTPERSTTAAVPLNITVPVYLLCAGFCGVCADSRDLTWQRRHPLSRNQQPEVSSHHIWKRSRYCTMGTTLNTPF